MGNAQSNVSESNGAEEQTTVGYNIFIPPNADGTPSDLRLEDLLPSCDFDVEYIESDVFQPGTVIYNLQQVVPSSSSPIEDMTLTECDVEFLDDNLLEPGTLLDITTDNMEFDLDAGDIQITINDSAEVSTHEFAEPIDSHDVSDSEEFVNEVEVHSELQMWDEFESMSGVETWSEEEISSDENDTEVEIIMDNGVKIGYVHNPTLSFPPQLETIEQTYEEPIDVVFDESEQSLPDSDEFDETVSISEDNQPDYILHLWNNSLSTACPSSADEGEASAVSLDDIGDYFGQVYNLSNGLQHLLAPPNCGDGSELDDEVTSNKSSSPLLDFNDHSSNYLLFTSSPVSSCGNTTYELENDSNWFTESP